MDSWEGLLEGGDEAEALALGVFEESPMVTCLHLPLDEDLRMPPKKKEQMEAYEIQLLDWWVRALPQSDEFEDRTLEAMEAPQEILEAAENLLSPEELQVVF